jgi:hypothetical protein
MFQSEHIVEMFQLEHCAECSGWNIVRGLGVWSTSIYHFGGSRIKVNDPRTLMQGLGWLICPTCLHSWFLGCYENDAGLGLGDGDRIVPDEVGHSGAGGFELRGGDEEG